MTMKKAIQNFLKYGLSLLLVLLVYYVMLYFIKFLFSVEAHVFCAFVTGALYHRFIVE